MVAGVRTVSSPDFAGYAAIGQLAGIPIDVVAGYKGSSEVVLSLVRGELDLAAFSAGSLRPFIEGGEVRPILQLSDRPDAEAAFLDGVPLLGGQDGWLAARDGIQVDVRGPRRDFRHSFPGLAHDLAAGAAGRGFQGAIEVGPRGVGSAPGVLGGYAPRSAGSTCPRFAQPVGVHRDLRRLEDHLAHDLAPRQPRDAFDSAG